MRARYTVAAVALVAVGVIAAVVIYNALRPDGAAAGVAALGAPRFVEEAQAAGVVHAYTGGFDYFVGGGVAAFDCNDDGLPELYIAGGEAPAALFTNRSEPGGELRFEPRPASQTDLDAVTGAYPLDIDGDGLTDLAVLRHGRNTLLRGLGDCAFELANDDWSFDGGEAWSTAFSAKWDEGAQWPTVAVGNYLNPDRPGGEISCADNELYAPAAGGRGFDAPTALSPSWCTLSLLFSDWDRSGRRDLRVSNDRHYYSEYGEGAEQLWRTEAGEAPHQYTEADGWKRLRVFGMGIGDYDVTGDGLPDYYLTSQADNKLQTLAGSTSAPEFRDIALERMVTAYRPLYGDTSLPSTAWHPEFQDVNNDGLIDLLVTKGNVEAQPDHAARDPNNLFLGQPDGSFREVSQEAGLVDFGRSRGAAVADLNLDGLLDMAIVCRLENVLVYRNVGDGGAGQPSAMGNWLELDLERDGPNRDAIGSWIEVRAGEHVMQRELTVGGGHVSGELVPAHFGLGDAAEAKIRITWPDGYRGEWQAVAANHAYSVARDEPPVEISWQ